MMSPEQYDYWQNQLLTIDRFLFNQLEKLDLKWKRVALTGIARHLQACRSNDCRPCLEALSEIIKDARVGRMVFAETNNDKSFVGNNLNNNF